MQPSVIGFVARTLFALPPRRFVVELGSHDVNGSIRGLFTGSTYIGIDLVPGPGVDVVADASTYEPPWAPDTVICCEVLEHAENAREIVENAYRMLVPGGVFIMTCATDPHQAHSAIDGGPLEPREYYLNVDPDEAQTWCLEAGFDALEMVTDPIAGDLQLFAQKALIAA